MKNRSNPARLLCSGLVFASLLPLAAATAAPKSDKMPMMDKISATTMADNCSDMMKQKKTMAAEMKADDIALASQVSEMNRAPAADKTSLLAAIVTKMSDQRTAMNASHAKMEEAMMGHMMEHMQAGKDSMAQCPMMKEMGEMKSKSSGAYPAHGK